MKQYETKIKDAYPIEINNIATDFKGITIVLLENNKELHKVEHNLPFFSNIKIIVFPEWDCDFYDKTSPSRHILTSRINGLYNILQNTDKAIILTTPKAIAPKTIPVSILKNNSFKLEIKQKIDIETISMILTELGYYRVNNAQNYGDYAIRGDIIDIANFDHEFGYRIDTNEDKIDKIKQFSLHSQISENVSVKQINILPTDEVIMNSETIANFTNNTKNTKNLMHLSIIDGIKTMNYIHYLPFFYEKPSSFFDYIKLQFQIIADTDTQSLLYQTNGIIDLLYQNRLSDSYTTYDYPEPKKYSIDLDL